MVHCMASYMGNGVQHMASSIGFVGETCDSGMALELRILVTTMTRYTVKLRNAQKGLSPTKGGILSVHNTRSLKI
jgi:hypothetical protein